ncbi:hypothetical protein LIER_29801 [Lithospermum erythrorhizon]|uniref:DUF4408 domain-containing protein n=1 Tax=Lithospermum erythrorhizon TaxID=34254 RepID=A0AAV3RLJ8_LITER
MDSFQNFQNIKAEKAKAMGRFHKMQKVSAFFKLIEVFIFLIVLSRFTTLFPISFKLSGQYVKEFFLSLVSPRFVFIIGNLIVFTLFWKSGQLSNPDCSNNNNEKLDFYDEYVKSCQRNPKHEIFTEKQSIKKQRKEKIAPDVVVCRDVVITDNYCMNEKKMHSSQSDRLANTHEFKMKEEKICDGLRRSKTEKCLKMRNNELVDVEEMSTEDFRLRVEAFIARQQRFLRGEDEED